MKCSKLTNCIKVVWIFHDIISIFSLTSSAPSPHRPVTCHICQTGHPSHPLHPCNHGNHCQRSHPDHSHHLGNSCQSHPRDDSFHHCHHDRTENACTASTSRCLIQSLRKVPKALYGTTGGTCSACIFFPKALYGTTGDTCSAYFFRPVMFPPWPPLTPLLSSPL